MSESIAGTYASLGGVEIINDSRTFAYLQNGLGPGSINVYGDCGCPSLQELLGCPDASGSVVPVTYVSPAVDNAPWYSADITVSGDFLGMIVDEFEGMESTFKRTVTESVGNGGVLNRSRLGTRSLIWKGFLFGATCCSVQYGLRWLTKTLSRFDISCRDCAGDDLELLVCCPDVGETEESPFRLLKGVGLLEGPTIISERKTCQSGCAQGCGGSCILEVEFTLVASQPYFYSPEIPVYDCVGLTDGVVIPPFTDEAVDCTPVDCSLALSCGIVELPPTAEYTNSCFPDILFPVANYYTVSRSNWNDLEEVVPIISITTGAAPIGQLKLGFYSSANDNPCADISLNPPLCNVICDELKIASIPANSTFYIDSLTRKMTLICPEGAYPGERLTAGPWSWPSFDCYGFCMEVIFANQTVFAAEELTCVSISLVPRTF